MAFCCSKQSSVLRCWVTGEHGISSPRKKMLNQISLWVWEQKNRNRVGFALFSCRCANCFERLLKFKLGVHEGLNHIWLKKERKKKAEVQIAVPEWKQTNKQKRGSWYFDEEHILEAPAMRPSHMSLHISTCPWDFWCCIPFLVLSFLQLSDSNSQILPYGQPVTGWVSKACSREGFY